MCVSVYFYGLKMVKPKLQVYQYFTMIEYKKYDTRELGYNDDRVSTKTSQYRNQYTTKVYLLLSLDTTPSLSCRNSCREAEAVNSSCIGHNTFITLFSFKSFPFVRRLWASEGLGVVRVGLGCKVQ